MRYKLQSVAIWQALRKSLPAYAYFFQLISAGLLAYLVQKIFAYRYGVSNEKTIFDLAFLVPFFIIYTSGFSKAHSILVVMLSSEDCKKNFTLASNNFSSLLNILLLFLAALVLITIIFINQITGWLASGLSSDDVSRVGNLIIILMPLSFSLAIGTFFSAAFVAYRIPVSQELILVACRVFVIIWMILNFSDSSLISIAYVYVLSAFLFVFLEAFFLFKFTPYRYKFKVDINSREIKDSLYKIFGFMIVSFVGQYVVVEIRRMAIIHDSVLAVAVIGYALSIFEPVGTISSKLVLFLFGPDIIKSFELNNKDGIKRFYIILLASFIIGSIFSVILIHFMDKIIWILYGGGAFDQSAKLATVDIASLVAWQIPFHMVTWICLYPLLNRAGAFTPFIYLITYMGQLIFINFSAATFGLKGIAISYPFAATVQAFISVIVLVLIIKKFA